MRWIPKEFNLDTPGAPDLPRNELRVVVVRARNLPATDPLAGMKDLANETDPVHGAMATASALTSAVEGIGQVLGPSADPFVDIEVEGIERKTTIKRRSLHPQWMELLQFPIDELDHAFKINTSCTIVKYIRLRSIMIYDKISIRSKM